MLKSRVVTLLILIDQGSQHSGLRGLWQSNLAVGWMQGRYLVRYYQLDKEHGCTNNFEFPATKSLCRWMEQVVESNDLQGVSEECANLLNHGLDVFLKLGVITGTHL